MRLVLALAAAAALVLGCGARAAGSELPAGLASLYAYDASRPLDARFTGQETIAGARVLGLDYVSPHGGRVPAKLVLPAGTGPFPVVLFQHGAGPESDQFLPEALDLAAAGVAGFLIAAPLNRPPFRPWFTFSNRDRRGFVQNVVDWRRAIDLLAGRPEIDARRIAFVGHSYGGAIAAIVSAVERRVSSVAILAGPAQMTNFLRRQGCGRSSSARGSRRPHGAGSLPATWRTCARSTRSRICRTRRRPRS